jgi:CRP-like cAMP-binding protein
MPADPEIIAALGATDLFGSLNKRSLRRLAMAAGRVSHESGKVITTQSEFGIGFHLILDGSATVSVKGRGKHQLGPGEYFGEISMIDGEPRSATVTATTPLTTAALTAWAFRPLLNEEPEIARALLTAICARLRKSERTSALPPN